MSNRLLFYLLQKRKGQMSHRCVYFIVSSTTWIYLSKLELLVVTIANYIATKNSFIISMAIIYIIMHFCRFYFNEICCKRFNMLKVSAILFFCSLSSLKYRGMFKQWVNFIYLRLHKFITRKFNHINIK